MDITPLLSKEKLAISGYGAGYFSLNGTRHDGHIFLCDAHVGAWDGTISEASLAGHLAPLALDLLLIGAGKNPIPVPPSLRASLKARNIAVEIMETGAACRTYNVLLAEGRRVAAALVAV